MQSEDGADAVVVLPADYAPDWMERTGRKLKMEYVGMGSVFTVIFKTAFVHLPRASQSAIATIGTLVGVVVRACGRVDRGDLPDAQRRPLPEPHGRDHDRGVARGRG